MFRLAFSGTAVGRSGGRIIMGKTKTLVRCGLKKRDVASGGFVRHNPTRRLRSQRPFSNAPRATRSRLTTVLQFPKLI